MTEKAHKKGKRAEVAPDEEGKKAAKPKREKRRRVEDAADDAENPSVSDTENGPQEPQKKKRKNNKTGFPDPEEDTALSEQASKALAYAFMQFRKPSKWKFSKARQNWLIRNIWSDLIPDTYLALTIQYLSNVQGGVRETLMKDCRSILASSALPDNLAVTTETSPTDELKRTRARALLDALEIPTTEPDPPK
ncbi:hypothetical protein C8R43DRAFT_1037261 [Mycena crocata]|nr:hypothetical protein C8R43DRAFT_1037261 [Mycena crocata]